MKFFFQSEKNKAIEAKKYGENPRDMADGPQGYFFKKKNMIARFTKFET